MYVCVGGRFCVRVCESMSKGQVERVVRLMGGNA